jgi:hypothetical protein
LQNWSKHIAGLLLLLFGITLLPFNFLHHHAEDEHALAMHHHESNAQHHCELDDYFCDVSASTQHCEHPQHMAKTIAKCFSCEFHFIKHYQVYAFLGLAPTIIQRNSGHPHPTQMLLKTLVFISNKGPPQKA